MHTGWKRYTRSTKYNASKVKLSGITFDSGLERDVYLMLMDMKNKGEIVDVKVKDRVDLIGDTLASRISLVVDFKVFNKNGGEYFVEAKGFPTGEWKLKRKLWMTTGPAPLEVWKRAGTKGLYLEETIYPKGCDADAT